MREVCYKCFRPKSSCLCEYTKQIKTGVKFVLLMHPKEAKKQRTGTGRITNNSLVDSEILVDLDFTNNSRLHKLLNDEQYYPMMLFPGKDAVNAKFENFCQNVGKKKLLVLVIDGTWGCAKTLIYKNQFLLKLPKLSFYGDYRSIFTFKKEPKPECISTIESCYYLVKELQSVGMVDKNVNVEPMMDVFKKLVIYQLNAENERIMGLREGTHAHDAKFTTLKEIPNFD